MSAFDNLCVDSMKWNNAPDKMITDNQYKGSCVFLIHFFFFDLQAITVPSMAVSHIMLESYKKYILVTLIVNGKIPTLPKYTSHVVAKYIKVTNWCKTDLRSTVVLKLICKAILFRMKELVIREEVFPLDIKQSLVHWKLSQDALFLSWMWYLTSFLIILWFLLLFMLMLSPFVSPLQPLCQPYHDLASAYGTNNPVELNSAVTKHTETFTRVS